MKPTMRRFGALVGMLALWGLQCGPSVPAVGSSELDRVNLSSSPLFAHYTGVLSGATTVGDLLTNTLSFSGKPTPTALLQGMQASNPPAVMGAVPVTVLSYNVALLDVQLFGAVPYTQTPELASRAAISGATIFARGYDIVAMQELWRAQDVERFRAAARAAGYWLVTSPRTGYTDGLAIAVKSSFAPEPPASEVRSESYAEISGFEFYPANGYSRGFLSVRIQHPTLGSMMVYDTHTAAFPAAYRLRMAHARQLGLHARANVREDELMFLCGDLNGAPYYRANDWALPGGGRETDWFANTLSYPVMMHYADVVDLAVRGRSAADATLDITLGDLVPNDPSTALQTPFGGMGYCDRTPNTLFTATDCNPLYFRQYAATEFPSRIDFVMARDRANRIHVAGAEVAFTEPVAYGGMMGPLSDHYGQLVRLQIRPR